MKLNTQIFHNFFYQWNESERGKSATSYHGHHFFSYSTEVGMIYTEGEGAAVCFIADSNFSNTTAAHISALVNACPLRIIRVPFEYGDDFSSSPERMPRTLKGRFLSYLSSYAPENFTRKPARDSFNSTLHHFRAFLEVTGQTIPSKERRVLETLEAAADETPESKARRVEAARKRAEKTRKENERRARELEKILKKWNVCTLTEKARFAFHDKTAPEIAGQLRRLLRADSPGFSFVWIDGDSIKTSQGVTFEVETAKRIYQLFKAGKITEGMHVGPYIVREITPDHVQIGCHRIPRENLDQVCTAL